MSIVSWIPCWNGIFFRWGMQLSVLFENIRVQKMRLLEFEEDYPKSQYLIPKHLKSCFYYWPINKIPKEAVYNIEVQWMLFVLMVCIYTYKGCMRQEFREDILFWGGIVASILLEFIFENIVRTKAFLNKYIKFTLNNFWYWFELKDVMVERKGKCKSVLKYKIKKAVYVDVKMLETEEIKKRIRISKYEDIEWNSVYEICTICKLCCVKKDDEVLMRAEVRGKNKEFFRRY